MRLKKQLSSVVSKQQWSSLFLIHLKCTSGFHIFSTVAAKHKPRSNQAYSSKSWAGGRTRSQVEGRCWLDEASSLPPSRGGATRGSIRPGLLVRYCLWKSDILPSHLASVHVSGASSVNLEIDRSRHSSCADPKYVIKWWVSTIGRLLAGRIVNKFPLLSGQVRDGFRVRRGLECTNLHLEINIISWFYVIT